jgi:hypothetical protein
MEGFERIEINAFAGGLLDLVNSNGVQTVALSSGNAGFNVQGSDSVIALEVNNTTGGATASNYGAAATSGTVNVQNVALNNAGSDLTAMNVTDVYTNNIETIALTATATATNNVTLVASVQLSTVTVAGAGSVNLTCNFVNLTDLTAGAGSAAPVTLQNTVTAFNASANNGDVNAAFSVGGNVALKVVRAPMTLILELASLALTLSTVVTA